jgi:hypothetical protein
MIVCLPVTIPFADIEIGQQNPVAPNQLFRLLNSKSALAQLLCACAKALLQEKVAAKKIKNRKKIFCILQVLVQAKKFWVPKSIINFGISKTFLTKQDNPHFCLFTKTI